MRLNEREHNSLREIKLTRAYTAHAEGSVLVEYGQTKVICNVSVVSGVPRFLKGSGQAWITAEYGMLPRATHERAVREAAKGRQSGRTQEIQRLIGRALRAAVDLKKLGEHTLTVDCDVIQADGGTRTASITGSMVALVDALAWLQERKKIKMDPLKYLLAAVSVGIYDGEPILDLDYKEDSKADTDLNVVMTEEGEFVEIQGTAEGDPFGEDQLHRMLSLAKDGILELIEKQREVLDIPKAF